MAQQQDPNGDPSAAAGERGIVAGSQDTYRSPGFRSSTLSQTGNTPGSGGVNGQPATPAAPAVGNIAGVPITPGVTAAYQGGPHSQPALANKLATGIFGSNLFKTNASPLQDIYGALSQGIPVSDYSWSLAGYGPGGATLAAPAAGAPAPTGLAGATLGAVNRIAGAPAPVPSGGTLATTAATRYANPALFGAAAL